MRVCKIVWLICMIVSMIAGIVSFVSGDYALFCVNLDRCVIAAMALTTLSLMHRVSLLEGIVYGKR